MTRPSFIEICDKSLLNNIQVIKNYAPQQKIIAMVKANAYGCGIEKIVPKLSEKVYAVGVACIEEALIIRQLDKNISCILFEGIFSKEELALVYERNFQIIIHQQRQLDWLLNFPSETKLKVWIKVNTGMNRLGFAPEELAEVMRKIYACPWVDRPIGIMSHLAHADDLNSIHNAKQLNNFSNITKPYKNIIRSLANSAAIIGLPNTKLDVIRPGLMLYGISPFVDKSADALGLKPVMRFVSKITEIHEYKAHEPIGYNGTWQSDKPSRIGIVPVGYADGYPRVVNSSAKVWVAGNFVPIVGRISMDMLTIDLTACKNIKIDDEVELWGKHITVNEVALASGTIGHEIISRVGSRVIRR